jgi:hypothetical protein
MPLLAPLISGLIAGLLWLFKSRIGLFIVSAMAWLGINWGTMKLAIEPAIDLLTGYAQSAGNASGQFGSVAVQWMGLLNFDKALTMVISAVAAKHAVMQGRLWLFKRGFGAKP